MGVGRPSLSSISAVSSDAWNSEHPIRYRSGRAMMDWRKWRRLQSISTSRRTRENGLGLFLVQGLTLDWPRLWHASFEGRVAQLVEWDTFLTLPWRSGRGATCCHGSLGSFHVFARPSYLTFESSVCFSMIRGPFGQVVVLSLIVMSSKDFESLFFWYFVCSSFSEWVLYNTSSHSWMFGTSSAGFSLKYVFCVISSLILMLDTSWAVLSSESVDFSTFGYHSYDATCLKLVSKFFTIISLWIQNSLFHHILHHTIPDTGFTMTWDRKNSALINMSIQTDG